VRGRCSRYSLHRTMSRVFSTCRALYYQLRPFPFIFIIISLVFHLHSFGIFSSKYICVSKMFQQPALLSFALHFPFSVCFTLLSDSFSCSTLFSFLVLIPFLYRFFEIFPFFFLSCARSQRTLCVTQDLKGTDGEGKKEKKSFYSIQ
jgi:hypothetical protein